MRSGGSTLLRGRARREELGHESRTREGQRVEEGKDGIRQQRDCSHASVGLTGDQTTATYESLAWN